MKRNSKIICTTFATAVGLFGIGRAIDLKMHGFSYLNCKVSAPIKSYFELQAPQNLNEVLNQTFTYLACGGESLVFESEDKKWVIKFCKRNRIDPLAPLQFLQIIPFLKGPLGKRVHIHNRYFHSLKIQATTLKDLSELFYVHLPHKNKQGPKLKLIDPLGSLQTFDTSDLSFSIQRKGELFRTVFLNKPSIEEKKEMLIKLVALYKQLESRGLKVWDNSISRNMGWIDDRPFIIDAGAVCDKPSHETFEQNLKYLKTWVIKYEPMLSDFVLDVITAHKTSDTL